MNFPRSSGILLHPTSLPGRYGIGDLGPQAYAFADFLKSAGQSLGRCCLLAQPDMAIHLMPATRLSPATPCLSVPNNSLLKAYWPGMIAPAFRTSKKNALILHLFINTKTQFCARHSPRSGERWIRTSAAPSRSLVGVMLPGSMITLCFAH